MPNSGAVPPALFLPEGGLPAAATSPRPADSTPDELQRLNNPFQQPPVTEIPHGTTPSASL